MAGVYTVGIGWGYQYGNIADGLKAVLTAGGGELIIGPGNWIFSLNNTNLPPTIPIGTAISFKSQTTTSAKSYTVKITGNHIISPANKIILSFSGIYLHSDSGNVVTFSPSVATGDKAELEISNCLVESLSGKAVVMNASGVGGNLYAEYSTFIGTNNTIELNGKSASSILGGELHTNGTNASALYLNVDGTLMSRNAEFWSTGSGGKAISICSLAFLDSQGDYFTTNTPDSTGIYFVANSLPVQGTCLSVFDMFDTPQNTYIVSGEPGAGIFAYGSITIRGGKDDPAEAIQSTVEQQFLQEKAAVIPVENGQLLIGKDSAPPELGVIEAESGSGITINYSSGKITVGYSGGTGFTWQQLSLSQQLIANRGYIVNGGVGVLNLQLPSNPSVGEILAITLDSATNVQWRISLNSPETIRLGTYVATTQIQSSEQGDTILMVCSVGGSGSSWTVYSSVGNIGLD